MIYHSASHSRVAIALHWSMAALIIANLFIGLFGGAIGKLLGGSPYSKVTTDEDITAALNKLFSQAVSTARITE
jgi:hypothetical protein